MQAFDVMLDVDPNVERSFTIDLVGLRPADQGLRNIDVDTYFQADSVIRDDVRDVRWTTNVPAGAAGEQIELVDADDPKWSALRDAGVMDLMVIVDRLNAQNYDVGGSDSRRLVIPLDRCRWREHPNRINVRAQSSRLDYAPHPDPAK